MGSINTRAPRFQYPEKIIPTEIGIQVMEDGFAKDNVKTFTGKRQVFTRSHSQMNFI